VVLAVFLRSQARLTTFSPIPTEGSGVDVINLRLAEVLDGQKNTV
jgi:hypothetical protein